MLQIVHIPSLPLAHLPFPPPPSSPRDHFSHPNRRSQLPLKVFDLDLSLDPITLTYHIHIIIPTTCREKTTALPPFPSFDFPKLQGNAPLPALNP